MHIRNLLRMAIIGLTLWTWAAGTAKAGIDEWTFDGPFGGDVYGLVVDPSTPTTLYASTEGSGVFKSTDGGMQWRPINEGLGDNLEFGGLAIDPQTPTTVYVRGRNRGVFKTVDGGDNWQKLAFDYLSLPVIDPLTPTTLYSIDGTLLRSLDGGANWSPLANNLPDDRRLEALAIDPQTPTTLYGFVHGSGLFKSTDGGSNWILLNPGPALYFIYSVAIDPMNSAIVYVTGNGGDDPDLFGNMIFKSLDGGVTWMKADHGLPEGVGSNGFELTFDPETPATLYAGFNTTFEALSGSIFKSIDSGDNWTEIYQGPAVQQVVIDPSNPDTVYAATLPAGVIRSTDGGAEWSRSNQGLVNTSVPTLAIDAAGAKLYAGTVTDGIYRSSNHGGGWNPTENGIGGAAIVSMVVDPQNPNTVYAGTELIGGAVFKSIDGGVTWERASTGTENAILSLAIDPVTPTTLYAGALFNGVFKTTDGGAQWVSSINVPGDLTVSALTIDPRTPAMVLAGANEGLLMTTDGGEIWVTIQNGLPDGVAITDLVRSPSDPDIVYALSGAGVFRSEDAGFNWDEQDFAASLLAIDPELPTSLYAADSRSVRRSLDSGATWVDLNAGLEGQRILDLLVDTGDPSFVYIGTVNHGVGRIQILADQPILSLHRGRFRVEVTWRDFQGETGAGNVASVRRPLPGRQGDVALKSPDSAVVQFFDPNNWEQLVKVLDGREINGHFWVFLASATNVGLTTTVSDTSCGGFKTYTSPLGQAAPAVTDVTAFVDCANPAPPSCLVDTYTLCLGEGGRFRVATEWADFTGATGGGSGASIPANGLARSGDSGLFTFFTPDNWELLVKVLDGCGINGNYWVFTAGTTNVEYILTITDTDTGEVKTYTNPLGQAAAAVTDIEAFASCP